MTSFTLPADIGSIRIARRRVAELAQGLVDAEVAALITSELVSNVVLHSHTDVGVRVDTGPPFRVEIHDGTAATVAFRELIAHPPPDVDTTAVGGRGIGLVHKLAVRLGLDDDPGGGKVVWFEL